MGKLTVGLAQRTMERRCREELSAGRAKADARIAQSLFHAAVVDRVPAILIFLAKVRLQMREVAAVELTGKDGERLIPQEQPQLTIVQETLPGPATLAAISDTDLRAELERRAELARVH